MSRKFSIRVAKEPRDWYGRKVAKGAIFGTEHFVVNGTEHVYDYIFEGDVRYEHRPDGSVCGHAVKVLIHHHRETWREYSSPDSGYYRYIWVKCTKGSLAEKLLNKHVKPDFSAQPEFRINNLAEYSSAIKRSNSKGVIYHMVRERQ